MTLQDLINLFFPGDAQGLSLSQGYGPTDNSFEPAGHGFAHFHTGLDISGSNVFGRDVYAPWSGTVQDVVNEGGFGNEEIFTPDSSPTTHWILGHLSRFLASGHVAAGTAIGAVGSTGNSTGPHLHLEEDVRTSSGGWTDVNPLGSNLTPGAPASTTPADFTLDPGGGPGFLGSALPGLGLLEQIFSGGSGSSGIGGSIAAGVATAVAAPFAAIFQLGVDAGRAVVHNAGEFARAHVVELAVSAAVLIALGAL